MRSLFVAAVFASALLAVPAARAQAAPPSLLALPADSVFARDAVAPREYPIHFDGPRLHPAQAVPDASNPSGLPNFNVRWHGGPVQTETTSYAIYWRPSGTYMSPTYESLIDRFLSDVGGSAIYGMATTYAGSNGYVRNKSTFGGDYVDTSPYPQTLNDAALRTEIAKVVAAKGWKPGIHSQFFMMTAKDALKTVNFCAYHSAFSYQGKGTPPVVYAFIPYFGIINGCNEPFGISPNKDPAADGAILNLSHEQEESVTDPLLNAWYDNQNGEIGDICIYSFGVPVTRDFQGNIVMNGHEYFLQEDWSQQADACAPNL